MSQFAINAIKFEDIRAKIVEYLKENSEYSATFDFEGSNMSMIIDTMAYVSMLMSYQLSNTTNNLFLDTTNFRKNAVSIAKTMGYRPKRATSAKVTGKIVYRSDQVFDEHWDLVIPARTVFIADDGYQFIPINDIHLTLSPDEDNVLMAEVELLEGSFKTYTYYGTGAEFQKFIIPSKNVEENNMYLYVRNNNSDIRTLWDEVRQSFNLMTRNSYFVEEDISNEAHVKVIFGDDLIGNFPTGTQIVEVEYLETSGDLANNLNIITYDTNNFTLSVSGIHQVFEKDKLSVEFTKSYGGKPYESLERIKDSAPKSFSMVGRAVTKNDFNTFLADNSYIYLSNVIGGDQLFKGNPDKLGNIYLTGIPLYVDLNNGKFFDNYSIYLSLYQEIAILELLERYRVISTDLHFMKPSYIYIKAYPTIEVPFDIKSVEEQNLINSTTNKLIDYVAENYRQFNPTLRASRLNSIIGIDSNIISTNIDFEYYFILSKDTFYEINDEDTNFILLPTKIIERDAYGRIKEVSNFIKTNLEQSILLNIPLDKIPYEQRTIYGQIATGNVSRFVYNEDIITGGTTEMCYLKIRGDNKFFMFYRFENDPNLSIVADQKEFVINGAPVSAAVNIVVTPTSASQGYFDDYQITIDPAYPNAVTIKRTYNYNGNYLGFAATEFEITITPSAGNFYEITYDFPLSGDNYTFTNVEVGEYIIYNPNLSGGMWQKPNYLGYVSAEDASGLFTSIEPHDTYAISAAGTFGGRTVAVTAGDYIIFNPYSTVNPMYKWEKLSRNLSYIPSLPASADFPTKATDYELKFVDLPDGGTTNFGGRTNTSFSDGDIIMFNAGVSTDKQKWQRILNVNSISAIPASATVDADPLSGGSLEEFDYHPVTGTPIGYYVRVNNIGDFGTSYTRVNWNGFIMAYQDDVLVYIGNGKWNLYQPAYPQVFNVDGTNYNSLPIALDYADYFSVSGSGNFNGGSSTFYNGIGEFVVYIGDGNWITLEILGLLNASTAAGLPKEAEIGDSYMVNHDGNFGNSYLIEPASGNFIEGDYIIFTGSKWQHQREYTAEYAQFSPDYSGKDYLNDLGFNSVFSYVYNPLTSFYEIYFNDIFHGTAIGTFKYLSFSPATISIYETGKMTFYSDISGSYDMNNMTDPISMYDLFDDYNINLIRMLPRNKVDEYGNLSSEPLTDFDTAFNNLVVFEINTAETIK